MILKLQVFVLLLLTTLINSLPTITASNNITCPGKCVCEEIKITGQPEDYDGVMVNCRQDKYDAFFAATELPENIQYLDLSLNRIKSLDTTDTMDSLRMLDLEGNSLSHLGAEAFSKMTKLTSLNLQFNNLTELPAGLFTSLIDLQVLKLSSNHLDHLSESLFDANINLKELHLNGNPLRIIYPNWFSMLGKLVKLDLSNTEIHDLAPETFHRTKKLEDLNLADNKFVSVPTSALRTARSVKKLVLNRNPIKVLNSQSFEHITNLEELEICQMPHLIEILAMTFSDQLNLERLTIADNPDLIFLDRLAFYGLFNATWLRLQQVSLVGNRLATLDQQSLPWCNLSRVDLARNPLNCDCKLNWLPDCKAIVRGPRCAAPEAYKGLEVHAIRHDEFVCSKAYKGEARKLYHTFVIAFGAIILFFVGLGIAMVLKRREIVRWWSEKRKGSGSIYYVKANSFPGDSQMDM